MTKDEQKATSALNTSKIWRLQQELCQVGLWDFEEKSGLRTKELGRLSWDGLA